MTTVETLEDLIIAKFIKVTLVKVSFVLSFVNTASIVAPIYVRESEKIAIPSTTINKFSVGRVIELFTRQCADAGENRLEMIKKKKRKKIYISRRRNRDHETRDRV